MTTEMAVNNLIAAAAMLAEGDDWKLAGATREQRPGFYVFAVEVPAGQERRAEEIQDICRPDRMMGRFDMTVHLGRFQEGFEALKRAMRTLDRLTSEEGRRQR